MKDIIDAIAFLFAMLAVFGAVLALLLAVIWGFELFIWLLPFS